MYLKNYTSEVAVSITIGRIEAVLIRCGVKGITKEYDGFGGVTALIFHIPMEGRDVSIRLPADVDATHEAMWQDYKTAHPDQWGRNRCRKTKKQFSDQASRTAWKLAQDWIEVEMSRIQIQKKEVVEVFMAYIWDGKQTFFNRVKDAGFRALLTETSTAE